MPPYHVLVATGCFGYGCSPLHLIDGILDNTLVNLVKSLFIGMTSKKRGISLSLNACLKVVNGEVYFDFAHVVSSAQM